MTSLHTRAFCDECGMRLAVVEISPGFFLCEQCNSVASIASSASDVNVTVADSSSPGPLAAVTSNSDPMQSPLTPPDASADCGARKASLLSFEDEVAALELSWLRAGIIMNAATLRVMQVSRTAASPSSGNSSSVAVS